MSDVTGVAFFPVTTFDGRGEFDEDRYREHVASTLDRAGFSCVIPLGSVGEFALLSPDERKAVIDATVDVVDDAVPVVPGTAATSTETTVELTAYAERAGVGGVLVPPYTYFPPTEATAFNYYRELDARTDVPIWVYNNPTTTGIDMDAALLSRLVDLESVTCIKSGTGNLRSFRNLRREAGANVDLFAAPPNMFEKLALGADGWSGPVATIDPEAAVEMFRALQNDELTAARDRFARWQPLLNFFSEYPYVAVMKGILELQGRDVGRPRAPVEPLDDAVREDLRAVMADLGVL